MRGRKPLPTEVKILQGTAQPCRLNPAEPKLEIGIEFEPPENLSPLAAEKWRFVVLNEGTQAIKRLDTVVLALYCALWAELEELQRIVDKSGQVLFDEAGVPQGINPAFNAKKKTEAQLIKVASELGFTPSSRSRVAATGKDPNADAFTLDMFDDLN